MEHWLHLRLQDHLRNRLRHAISHGGDAECAFATIVLWYLDEPYGRWKVRARRHSIPDLIEIPLEILLEHRQRLAVHTRCTAVCLYPTIRIPNELLRNVIGLCFRHRLLPSLVGPRPLLDRQTPSLHRRYQASSLRRARPPLRLASVFRSSWVNHLEFCLRIEATGSRVPHKSLRWAHAAFMPLHFGFLSAPSWRTLVRPNWWWRACGRH